MTDCSCNNFPASLGNVTFGASLGIGTTAPQYLLDVERPAGGPVANLRLSADEPGTGATINPYGAAAVVYAAGAEYDGTASATQFEHLNDSFNWYGDTNLTSGNPYPRTLRMTLDGAGQVGIGTSTPQTQLHLASTDAPDSQIAAESLLIETSGYGDNNLTFARYSDTAWSKVRLQLAHARGSKASPAPLQDGDWLGILAFGGWSSSGWANGVDINATVDGTPSGTVTPGKLVLNTVDSGGTNHTLTMRANGNVGIATDSPGYPLTVAGTIQYTSATAGIAGLIDNDAHAIRSNGLGSQVFANGWGHPAQGWIFRDEANSADRLIITSAGSVGIGTDSPGYPLDVVGTVRCTGVLLGGDQLMSGALKDSTGNRTNVDSGGCYFAP